MDSGLLASLFSIEVNLDICVVNIYGPYSDKEGFWRNLFDLICHKGEKLILGGDLNFSLGFCEIWGNRARLDPLSDFFTKSLENYDLVDVVPSVMLPTWNNRIVGADNICKRLDRFLLSVDLLDFDYFFR